MLLLVQVKKNNQSITPSSSANMQLSSMLKSIVLLPVVVTLVVASASEQPASDLAPAPKAYEAKIQVPSGEQSNNGASLEPRMSDKNFIADILNRLHSLDADIGKLLFNSSSMYAADDHSIAFQENQPKGAERFSEVLNDLDALQDEVSVQ